MVNPLRRDPGLLQQVIDVLRDLDHAGLRRERTMGGVGSHLGVPGAAPVVPVDDPLGIGFETLNRRQLGRIETRPEGVRIRVAKRRQAGFSGQARARKSSHPRALLQQLARLLQLFVEGCRFAHARPRLLRHL